MVAALYTKEVAQKVRDIRPPYKGINFDIIDRKEFLSIRLKEEETTIFSNEQRLSIMEYLIKIRDLLAVYGIRCEFEGIPYRGSGS